MGRMMCMGELTVGRVGKEVRRGSNLPEQDQPTLPPLPEERCISEQLLISDSSAACSSWKLMLKVSLAHFDTGAGGVSVWGAASSKSRLLPFRRGLRAFVPQPCRHVSSCRAAALLSPSAHPCQQHCLWAFVFSALLHRSV